MLGPLGFAPWQYGLAFGAPCVGGLLGARLAGPLVARFGAERVLRTAGAARACWSLGLAFVVPGTPGLALVLAVQFGLVTCIGVFNPVFATHRLTETPPGHVARTLSAWSVTSSATVATLTALWGLLAAAVGPRPAIALAGLLLLLTPLLLPSRRRQRDLCPFVVRALNGRRRGGGAARGRPRMAAAIGRSIMSEPGRSTASRSGSRRKRLSGARGPSHAQSEKRGHPSRLIVLTAATPPARLHEAAGQHVGHDRG